MTFVNLGPKFRKHRKMLQNAFSPPNCIPYRPKQEDLSRILVSSLLDSPAEWERLLVRYAFQQIKEVMTPFFDFGWPVAVSKLSTGTQAPLFLELHTVFELPKTMIPS